MSEIVLVALITALPPTLMALGAWMQVGRVEKKTDTVHVLVNSNMAALREELAAAKAHIQQLEDELMESIIRGGQT